MSPAPSVSAQLAGLETKIRNSKNILPEEDGISTTDFLFGH